MNNFFVVYNRSRSDIRNDTSYLFTLFTLLLLLLLLLRKKKQNCPARILSEIVSALVVILILFTCKSLIESWRLRLVILTR